VLVLSEHLASRGCVEIPRREYMRRLDLALGEPVLWA
jgi:Leu/Phe-tRNA-protein transferase